MAKDLAWCIEQLLQMYFKAKVGHVGGSISCLPGLHATYTHMRSSDRFVLSKGHSAGALYVVLAAFGHIPEEQLHTFHQDDTTLPGHPPANVHAQIPFATGSLGHGLSLASGFALSQKLRGSTDRTFCLTSDGEWQEGSTWEALIFAAHHKLANLTVLIDHNLWQGFGTTADVASMDPLWDKIRGFDVAVTVIDGTNYADIQAALAATYDKPHFIFLQTTKGRGIDGFANTLQSHYLPMNTEQLLSAMEYYNNHAE